MIPFKLRKCSYRNLKYLQKHKIKKNIFICWHRSNSWGICNSALIHPPCPPALALKFFCVLCLKGIPSCLCLWRLLALHVWSTSNSGWSCCTRDKGPLCSGKCVQRCLRAVRKSAALLRVGAIDQCCPHYPRLWENLQEAQRMRKYSEFIHLAPHLLAPLKKGLFCPLCYIGPVKTNIDCFSFKIGKTCTAWVERIWLIHDKVSWKSLEY